MKIKFLSIYLVLGYSLHAQGAEVEKLNNSLDIRSQKSFGIGLGLGQFMESVPGKALNVHYNVHPNIQIEASLWGGKWRALEDAFLNQTENAIKGIALMDVTVNVSQSQLRLKYFSGYSFYGAVGLGTRSISLDTTISSGIPLINKFTSQSKANTTILNLGIGNEWRFESGAYVSIEWLAFGMPLMNSMDISTDSGKDEDPEKINLKKMEYVLNKHSKALTTGTILPKKRAILSTTFSLNRNIWRHGFYNGQLCV